MRQLHLSATERPRPDPLHHPNRPNTCLKARKPADDLDPETPDFEPQELVPQPLCLPLRSCGRVLEWEGPHAEIDSELESVNDKVVDTIY
jgi:hypothetical protein